MINECPNKDHCIHTRYRIDQPSGACSIPMMRIADIAAISHSAQDQRKIETILYTQSCDDFEPNKYTLAGGFVLSALLKAGFGEEIESGLSSLRSTND